jgi:hypothetical protein
MVYGCDAAWWQHRKGLPEFSGLKACFSGNGLADYPDIRRIDIDKRKDLILLDRTGKTGSGGNSGFQALNLAVQFGTKRILLLGYDMHIGAGFHWYGKNNWQNANNPNDSIFARWIAAFDGSVSVLKSLGVEVINCSMNSALNCFPKRPLEDAIAETIDLDRV